MDSKKCKTQKILKLNFGATAGIIATGLGAQKVKKIIPLDDSLKVKIASMKKLIKSTLICMIWAPPSPDILSGEGRYDTQLSIRSALRCAPVCPLGTTSQR